MCLIGIGNCIGCGKDGQKVRDFPIIASKGREGKQVGPNVPKDDAPNKSRSDALRTRGENLDDDD